MQQLQRLFAVVRNSFEICTTKDDGCATHVHIGTASSFNLSQIRKLSQGVFLFQDILSVASPFDEYSRTVPLPSSHYAEVQSLNKNEILMAMNPPLPPTNLDTSAEWDRKYVAWNFLSLDTLGTIEYRQGIFSTSPRDAVGWITLALAAVHVFLDDDLDVLFRAHRESGGQSLLSLPRTALTYLLRNSEYLTVSDPCLDIPPDFLD
ncbi:hypothetical protein QQS21_001459 [Conoideocrella luteorostrata]|uniref:Amidoligase enzyme-domain-containing protein n=1 Tax=Conoideocrella luteorostrata TaxID=1105319 RepID=A0AAJ0CX65_9HYPO|nr:hypothetical protein QQS21_001459 [Conoideocrella luteorostrata]